MTYTVRDMYQVGVKPPGDTTAPSGGPLYDYVASRLHLYDPNSPDDDTVTMSLDISDPDHTTAATYSTGSTIWCFFWSNHTFHDPRWATGFGPNEDWTHGAYYGARGTSFADVTGDGRADAIGVNDDTVTVRGSI